MGRPRAHARLSRWPGWLIILFGLSVSAGGAVLAVVRPPAISRLDNLVFDTLAREEEGRGDCRLPVVVGLDDEALARFGRWPWPRSLFARLLDRLAALRPASVGVDVLFPEPELPLEGGPPRVSDGEEALAKSLQRGPFVLGWEFTFTAAAPDADCPPRPHALRVTSLRRPAAAEPTHGLWSAPGAVCSLPRLREAARWSGFLNAGMDADGILRRIPLLIEHDGDLYPSLALATALQAIGARQAVLESTLMGGRILAAGNRRIPLDSRGRLRLRYRCQEDGAARVSAAAILDGRVPAEIVKGRTAFIGAAGTGLGESIATPIAPTLTGVEVHAIAAGNILEGDFAREAPPAPVAAAVLAIGVLATIACLWLRPLSGALVLGAAAVLAWLGSGWLFHSRGLAISPVLPVLTLASEFVILTLVRGFHGEKWSEAQTRDLAATRDFVTESLVSLAAIRDTETGAHILRTQRYVRLLCQAAARHPRFSSTLTPRIIELTWKLAPIHDIGKVGVPDDLLRKPTRLTPEEYEVVRNHARHGRDAIATAETRVRVADAEFLRVAKDIVYSHHERWDGSGYPQGLSGDDIPLAARVMAIADVYDALVSLRVYKGAVSHEEAVRIIREGRGTQFDPDLVDAFLGIEHRWKEIQRELADAGQPAGVGKDPA